MLHTLTYTSKFNRKFVYVDDNFLVEPEFIFFLQNKILAQGICIYIGYFFNEIPQHITIIILLINMYVPQNILSLHLKIKISY
jgi:hypothetical protein